MLYHFKNQLSQAFFEIGSAGIMSILKMGKVHVPAYVHMHVCMCMYVHVYKKNKSHING